MQAKEYSSLSDRRKILFLTTTFTNCNETVEKGQLCVTQPVSWFDSAHHEASQAAGFARLNSLHPERSRRMTAAETPIPGFFDSLNRVSLSVNGYFHPVIFPGT